MNELTYEYWWAAFDRLTDLKKCKLYDVFGGAKHIFHASKNQLESCGFLETEQIAAIQASKSEAALEKATDDMIAKGIHLTTLGMEDYPRRLRALPDAPYGLFYYGSLDFINQPAVGMVGARRASAYGRTMSEHFARSLAEHGVVIVSGMARGIDGASHRGALKAGGKTVAILGGGVDICYPKENRDIYEEIKATGLVMSQYCPGTQPKAFYFPARNRIISGLSQAVLVMEAKEKSGSLITVDFALEQGKDIFAMPGRITDAMSCGCNRLIQQGAGLLQTPDLFWQEFESYASLPYIEETELHPKLTHFVPIKNTIIDKTSEQKDKESENSPEFSLEKEESLVYSCFDFYPRGIQDVADVTGLDILKLISIVMRLCEFGLIRESFKNQYIRCK